VSQTENGVTSAPYHHQQLLWLKSSRYRICPRTKRFELFRNLIASFFLMVLRNLVRVLFCFMNMMVLMLWVYRVISKKSHILVGLWAASLG
jgi:hypothetical protein